MLSFIHSNYHLLHRIKMSTLKTLGIGLGILAAGTASACFTNIFNIQEKTETLLNTNFYTETEKVLKQEAPEGNDTTAVTQNIKTQFTLYFDFGCPHCRDFFEKTYIPLKSEYSEKNVDFTILPYSQKTVGKSFTLAKQLTCIQKINKNKADKFIQTISITDDIKNEELFAEKIKTLELSDKENSDFFTCIKDEDESAQKKTIEVRTQAQENGVIGTPTFFINDVKFERNQSYLKVSTYLESELDK